MRLHRCGECGLLFAPDRNAGELQDLYDARYFDEYPGGESYEEDPAQRRYEAARRIELVRRYRRSGRLLEIGAAAGHFVEAARDSGFDPIGVEPAADLARAATERLGVPVLAGFIEEVDLPDGEFDVACAWHVVEHLSEPHHALVRLRDALVPGGHLFVEVPNIDSVQATRRRQHWANLDIGRHVGHYTSSALRALLEGAGFDVLMTETAAHAGLPTTRARVASGGAGRGGQGAGDRALAPTASASLEARDAPCRRRRCGARGPAVRRRGLPS